MRDKMIKVVCEDCQEEISEKRLREVPETTRCCRCQQELENRQQDGHQRHHQLELRSKQQLSLLDL